MFRCNLKFLLISIIGIPFIASAHDDKLCEQLIAFASKTKVGEILSVKLVNDWSNFSKSCDHNNTEEGKEFCGYLIKNTSTEFMNLNLTRILSCSNTNFSFGNVLINKSIGEFSVFEVPGLNPDITLNINFSIGADKVKDYMEIVTEFESFE